MQIEKTSLLCDGGYSPANPFPTTFDCFALASWSVARSAGQRGMGSTIAPLCPLRRAVPKGQLGSPIGELPRFKLKFEAGHLEPPHPFQAGPLGPDPGAWDGMWYADRNEDAERPRRRYRSRLNVRGVGETWYFYRKVVLSAVPGLRALRVSSALRVRMAKCALLAQSLRGCAPRGGEEGKED